MKKKILLLAIFLTCSSTILFANNNIVPKRERLYVDTLLTYLKNLNLAQFANKSIDSLIAKLPPNYIRMYVRGGGRDDIAGILSIRYSNNIYVLIRVTEFTYMNRYNPQKLPPAQVWDVNLMRKEKIYSIRVIQNDTLYNNFNEPE